MECQYSDYNARVSTGYFPAINYQAVLAQMGYINLRQVYVHVLCLSQDSCWCVKHILRLFMLYCN
jgi:hypothetical protein